jgi:mono/diheme cytochrome c family protein
MSLRRLVNLVEIVALVAALAFVLLLFVNEPDNGGDDSGGAAQSPGAEIYSSSCATCHGATGKGSVGPRLADVVVGRYPDVADEIEIVTDGRLGMPAFAGRLSTEEIREVVEYTRTDLGG